jgi:DNA-directed RNA polymerase alpha subunit
MSDDYSDDAAEFVGIEESIASVSDVYYEEDDFEQDAASPDHSQATLSAALDVGVVHAQQESTAVTTTQPLQQQSAYTPAVPVQHPARLAAVQQQFEQAKAELHSAATARLAAALAKRKRADTRRLQHIQELTQAKQAAAAAQADSAALNAELSAVRAHLQRQSILLATKTQEYNDVVQLSETQHNEILSSKQQSIKDLQAACAIANSEIDAAKAQTAQLQVCSIFTNIYTHIHIIT